MITKEKKKRIGALRQKVDVERYTTTSDGMGGTTQTWNTHITGLWVDIRPLDAKEQLEFGKLDSTVTHEILTRHGVDVTGQDRIKYKGRNFEIKHPINEGEEDAFIKFSAAENAD